MHSGSQIVSESGRRSIHTILCSHLLMGLRDNFLPLRHTNLDDNRGFAIVFKQH
jgi:hypothetical protein